MTGPIIRRAARLDCRVAPYDWPFARDRAGEIAAHWRTLVSANQSFFDGRVLLSNACALPERDGGVLRATYFEVAFSAFIAWRDFGHPDKGVQNSFAMAALKSSDGAWLLGEMAANTANGGMVYFPAGTPDLHDVVGETVDLDGSVARELHEETGIDIAEAEVDPHWTIVHLGPRVACMKEVRLRETADAAIARVARTIAAQNNPELTRLRAVRDRSDLAGLNMPDFARAFLLHEFGA